MFSFRNNPSKIRTTLAEIKLSELDMELNLLRFQQQQQQQHKLKQQQPLTLSQVDSGGTSYDFFKEQGSANKFPYAALHSEDGQSPTLERGSSFPHRGLTGLLSASVHRSDTTTTVIAHTTATGMPNPEPNDNSSNDPICSGDVLSNKGSTPDILANLLLH
ncbi:unnamed protein product [Ambrosiozyma monospora]|uniref:Unnamed protein product n=1 Tax=Ambrosiozyma monospora TaxID=43982 RepID=A0ACB5U698_AMBMO|nr:unnamed protein product [Ambrosiozyma monospora]